MKWPWTKQTERTKGTRNGGAIITRGFAAAQTDRLLAGWRYDGGFTPSEISTHLDIIRGRARQMAKDSPHLKRWLQLIAINIVGQGFSLKSTPYDGGPGARNMDETAAKIIEYHWWKFCTTPGYCDTTGTKTMAMIDRLNAKTWARDGEYFIHVRPARNPYGISFRVLRPDWCDEKYNISDTGKGTLIHCGVEKEIETRKVVAYWFFTVPQNAHAFNGRGQPLIRIPATEIIHGFTPEDEDQPRGVPWSHAGLRKLKMLDEYDLAEMTAARDEACTVRQYTAERPADIDAFADLTSDENADTARALTAEKEAGQSEIVPPGWKGEAYTPHHPNRELTAFKSSMLKDVASAFGVEYSNFANDWAGVSFSSVRVGTISERDAWITLQDDMISQSKSPQFLAWLKSFLTYSVSGKLPLTKMDKFAEHEFRGRRWMWVDPMKDMNAAKMCVDNGWKTNTDVAADLGNDYGDNLDIMKTEKKKRTETGFVPVVPAGSSAAIPATDTEEDDNETKKAK